MSMATRPLRPLWCFAGLLRIGPQSRAIPLTFWTSATPARQASSKNSDVSAAIPPDFQEISNICIADLDTEQKHMVLK